MSVTVVGSYSLLEVNVAAAASLAIFVPVLAQFDLTLTGPFGLGALQFDITAQFNAALSASVQLKIEVSDPLGNFKAAIQGLAQLQASLQAALTLGFPSVSAELGIGVSAQLAITAALGAKVGGIFSLLQASLKLKLSALNFIGTLQGALSAGPVFLLSFDGDLASAGSAIGGSFLSGLVDNTNGNHIQPGDDVHGIVLVTKDPSAWLAIQATMRTS